jgi:aspartyl-tRNA(Asn)/glutamyl-tRNA(Gln) amidotransferase subunit A
VTDEQLDAGLAAREAYGDRLAEIADGFDVLLTPTLGFVAPDARRTELELRDAMVRLTYPFNLTGWPALALPCGPADDGLPASVQLVAPPGSDGLVLAVGEALEAALRP